MNKIYDLINERTGGKYNGVRFCSVVFEETCATVRIVARTSDVAAVSEDLELKRLLTEICEFGVPLRVTVEAEDLSPRILRDTAAAFTRKFPFVASIANGITVTAEPPTVHLSMHESMKSLASDDYVTRLDEFLKNRYITPIAIAIDIVALDSSSDADAPHEPKIYEIKTGAPYFGDAECSSALSAADVSGNRDDIAVCGILSMATEYMSKSDGVKQSRPYQKFVLYDGTGTLKCLCFPRNGFSLVESELIGKPVCAFGNSEIERGRTGETAMTVRALLPIVSGGPSPLKAPSVPKEYTTVKPQPYEEYVQTSLFVSEEVLPPSLKGAFVAFDFETTGLSIAYDKPTELGAVKICDGVITETFSTLIDPRRPIPEDVSAKTGITDDMVRGKPLFEDVLPDFYKFTYGCALIGHNIAFDFPFLLKYGNKHGWTFGDRKTFDTLGIAPRALPGIEMLTLDYVLDKLGLVNDNAHRALSDATATAKAFIAMKKILSRASDMA